MSVSFGIAHNLDQGCFFLYFGWALQYGHNKYRKTVAFTTTFWCSKKKKRSEIPGGLFMLMNTSHLSSHVSIRYLNFSETNRADLADSQKKAVELGLCIYRDNHRNWTCTMTPTSKGNKLKVWYTPALKGDIWIQGSKYRSMKQGGQNILVAGRVHQVVAQHRYISVQNHTGTCMEFRL